MELRTEEWLCKEYHKLINKNNMSKSKSYENSSGNQDQAEPAGEYAIVSMKVKRFPLISHLYGRDASDELNHEVCEAIEQWLLQEEYAALLHRGNYLMMVKLPTRELELVKRFDDLEEAIGRRTDVRFRKQISCGYGVYWPKAEEDFETAHYFADRCRTESPENKKWSSHLEIFHHEEEETAEQFRQQPDIIGALNRQELHMYLQPKVDLKTGEVHAAEALIRWIDPVYGFRPLNSFLPALEAVGMTDYIDFFIFEQACRSLERWNEESGKEIRISVNLSGRVFGYPMFLQQFQSILARYHCPPECLEFELLESLALNQTRKVSETVHEIRKNGFHCSLDDFGSGYASYSVLTHTDLSAVKLDRSLFGNEENQRERLVIKHIVQTARELGMKTVAEGVETKGYVEYLKELKCDYIQGYVFYKPMPEAEFEKRFIIGNEKVML